MGGGFTWRFSHILNYVRTKLEMLLKHNPTWDYKSVLSIINPFAPEPPVRIRVLSNSRDVISFNGQGQLCQLTYAE